LGHLVAYFGVRQRVFTIYNLVVEAVFEDF